MSSLAGRFITPTDTSGTTTLANMATSMPPNLRMFLPNPDGEDSYPIVTYSWLLLYKSYVDKAKAAKVRQFISWGLREGQAYAAEYGDASLPDPIAASARNQLATIR